MRYFGWLVLIVLCFTVACSPKEGGQEEISEDSEVRIAVTAQPETLDNHLTTATMASDIGRNIFETLVTLNEYYEPVPMLAQSIEQSEDGKTYTFQLRKGVTFHNGKDLTAEDVVVSMNRWIEYAGGEDLQRNGHFEVAGDLMVVLNLKEPMSDLLDLLADRTQFPSIMPKEVVETAGANGVTEYIGTGPYQFVDWKQDQYIQLTKYEQYKSLSDKADGFSGKKKAKVTDLYFDIVPDPSTRVAGIQTGEYDIITEAPPEDYEKLRSEEGLETYPYQFGNMFLIYNKAKGMFTDQTLRQAVNAAVDAESVMQASFANKDLFTLDSGYMDPQQKRWYSDAGQDVYSENNPQKAKQLLEEASYDGEVVRILTTRQYDFLYNASIVLQERLEEIGMKTELEVYDWPTVLELQNDQEAWDLHITAAPIVVSPTNLLFLNPNWAGWTEDDHLTVVLEQIRKSSDQTEAAEIWSQLEAYLWREYVPVTIFGAYKKVIVTQDYIESFNEFEGGVLWNMENSK